MKENMELERKDLVIDRDMEVDCDIGQQITCYIETWFDVDEKFRIKTDSENGTWLNMYGKYDPFADTLRIECVISGDDFSDMFDYQPTAAETQLIKDMITEKIREVHGQTPKEFCDSLCDTGQTMGGMYMTQYLYPQNLKATANLWLWGLRDFAILGIAALLSIVCMVQFGFFIPAAATLCYGFLTIRMDETTVMDFIKYAIRYFITTQQYYEWR